MKKKRLADPYWLRCCELWDKLTEYERAAVIEMMEYYAGDEKSPTTPTTPEVSEGGPDSQGDSITE